MEKEWEFTQVSCPSCKADEFNFCTDMSGVMVDIHVARKRKYRRKKREQDQK